MLWNFDNVWFISSDLVNLILSLFLDLKNDEDLLMCIEINFKKDFFLLLIGF